MTALRVGVDVGGTFTKAVAVSTSPVTLLAQAVVPTSHHAPEGVVAGVGDALTRLLDDLGERRSAVELVAYSTTTAMNALLEGDVARVGVVGIGAHPELRRARKRTRVGDLRLAAGRVLATEHVFLDATHGLDDAAIDGALEELAAAGCTAVAVSGAFSVDAPEQEDRVAARARACGLPVCAGHELTGSYGLELRTVSAAINASILPVVEGTARVVERVLAEAGIDVPLLVLRGDGGAMALDAFRRAPSLTIGSGPAAGVAAALHRLGLTDAIVVECGGTSSNVSIVKRGRTVLRDVRVMGRPTAIRSVDSWVVGAAGGSMARLGRRRIEDVGPRSAHVADLPYACFADPADLREAQAGVTAPRRGDPPAYATVAAPDGRAWAITATCAATALGCVEGRDGEAARLAFAALGRRLRRDALDVARDVLDGAVEKIAEAAAEAGRAHDLGRDVPIVALGGAGGALAPEVAKRLGRPVLLPEDPEVLSSIGAALSLVRVELVRHSSGNGAAELVRDAERACVDAGAAPLTVSVTSMFEAKEGVLRAVATGAVALESGVAARRPLDEDEQRAVAADATGAHADTLRVVAATGFYRVFADERGSRVAVVDGLGAVPVAEPTRRVVAADDGAGLLDQLRDAVAAGTTNLGVAAMLPRVCVVSGAHVVDLSDSRRAEDIFAGAAAAVNGNRGPAVALVCR
ncbi:MAG TPA: hydantoinase/oxoprolinase family protein [Solirubrobacteraceae bacterium]